MDGESADHRVLIVCFLFQEIEARLKLYPDFLNNYVIFLMWVQSPVQSFRSGVTQLTGRGPLFSAHFRELRYPIDNL